MNRILAILLLAGILAGCAAPTVVEPTPTAAEQHPWWETAVFYEIFVRSFFDTDGNGIGDFNGITSKLDYLQDLGVNAIWLMPVHPSPSYHGYDVINYFNVNPDYGTMDDFKRLLGEAHRRGMHLVIDLVVNHTSNQNPWFVDANNNLESPYRDWYTWEPTDPGYTGPLGDPWHPGKQGFYYGIFSAAMPDLNYDNPQVSEEMLKIVGFWLQNVGVDGFRVDAVKYLIEEGQKQENTASTHAWFEKFYSTYKAMNPNAFTVGEVYGAGAFTAKTYKNELDEIFSFELASGFVNSAQGGSNTSINSAVQFTLKDMPDGPYATFLTNHDQNRVMSVMDGNVDKAKVAAAMMFSAPGTVFIYYGEEIGMQGEKPDEDIRRPMQWSSEANAGFTSGTPWRAPDTNYAQVNVALETADPGSLLSFYRTFIDIRGSNPALQTGSLSLVATSTTAVYSVLRVEGPQAVLVVINLTKSPVNAYGLSLAGSTLADGSYKLKAIYGSESEAALPVSQNSFTSFKPVDELSAFGIYVYQLER